MENLSLEPRCSEDGDGVDNSTTYLAVASVKQLDSLPCQVNSALFARCLNHCRDAGVQHAAGADGKIRVLDGVVSSRRVVGGKRKPAGALFFSLRWTAG